MTMQEYFDKTAAHLRSMDEPASEDGLCYYLTDDGRKCAVGCHIPDGHPGLRCTGGVEMLIRDHPDLVGVAVPDHERGIFLAQRLQGVHDGRGNWKDGTFTGEAELCSVALNFGLTYTPPEGGDV